MGKALIIVDVQPTFCEGGELGVEGGNAVAERIAKYVESHRGEYAYIATTQDWHIEPGTHWSDDPDYVDTWPVHGKAGTANAELHPAIAALKITHHSRRDSIRRHTPVSKDRKTTPTAFPHERRSTRIWRRARRLPMRCGRLASRAWTSSDWRNRIA